MHCVPCLGCFLVFIVCPIVLSMFGSICCGVGLLIQGMRELEWQLIKSFSVAVGYRRLILRLPTILLY